VLKDHSFYKKDCILKVSERIILPEEQTLSSHQQLAAEPGEGYYGKKKRPGRASQKRAKLSVAFFFFFGRLFPLLFSYLRGKDGMSFLFFPPFLSSLWQKRDGRRLREGGRKLTFEREDSSLLVAGGGKWHF